MDLIIFTNKRRIKYQEEQNITMKLRSKLQLIKKETTVLNLSRKRRNVNKNNGSTEKMTNLKKE